MRVGIMQPYFFPYIGYFALVNYVDEFIFFDTPQYINHGWVNRNRILRQNGVPGYVTVPIQKASQNTSIKDIKISNSSDWKNKIFGQITVYKKKAPYYKEILLVLHSILDKEYEYLADLNIESIKTVCTYIGIEKNLKIFSQMGIGITSVNHPDEWALKITKAIDGKIYVNPPGGQSFFDKEKYNRNNIELEFLQSNLPAYIQKIGHFEAGLSIIDVMMFCSPKEVRDMLDNFQVIR